MALYGKMIEVKALVAEQIQAMFLLMDTFYDQVLYAQFIKDLEEKDYCILLLDEAERIQGFSTQKLMTLQVDQREIHGVFSGDTIIHRDYWGSMELFKVFTQNFIKIGKSYDEFYWFLISKGYKTYKMLPLFFNTFYPNYQEIAPDYEKQIMAVFGHSRYPKDYDEETGIIAYHSIKDRLKKGVAEITEKQLKDPDIQYFQKINPKHFEGQDLVCLARLEEDNLKPIARRLFMGE